jgi:hypothetical protein
MFGNPIFPLGADGIKVKGCCFFMHASQKDPFVVKVRPDVLDSKPSELPPSPGSAILRDVSYMGFVTDVAGLAKCTE